MCAVHTPRRTLPASAGQRRNGRDCTSRARSASRSLVEASASGTLAPPSRQAAWRPSHGPGVRLLGQLEPLSRGPTPRGGTGGHARRQISGSHPLREPATAGRGRPPPGEGGGRRLHPPGDAAAMEPDGEPRGADEAVRPRREGCGEQEVPDRWLQLCMLEDGWDNNGDPGIVALLTGDGAGYAEGRGFHRTLERMHGRGWRVEVLSWAHSCNEGMRRPDDRSGCCGGRSRWCFGPPGTASVGRCAWRWSGGLRTVTCRVSR